MPVAGVILCVGLLVVFLTEVTSNTATASLLLPVLGALSSAAVARGAADIVWVNINNQRRNRTLVECPRQFLTGIAVAGNDDVATKT